MASCQRRAENGTGHSAVLRPRRKRLNRPRSREGMADAELDRAGALGAGRALGGLAVLRARRQSVINAARTCGR